MSFPDINRKKIAENRRQVFIVESAILDNKVKSRHTGAVIDELHASIIANYSAAFCGNLELANQNTEDMFRNRIAIINNLVAEDEVEENYIESMRNQIHIDYLTHRVEINTNALEVGQAMLDVNKALIDINEKVMRFNEEVKSFNTEQIKKNRIWMDSDEDKSTDPSTYQLHDELTQGATTEANHQRIENNRRRLDVLVEQSQAYSEKIDAQHKAAHELVNEVRENAQEIAERRKQILSNHNGVVENKKHIAAML